MIAFGVLVPVAVGFVGVVVVVVNFDIIFGGCGLCSFFSGMFRSR